MTRAWLLCAAILAAASAGAAAQEKAPFPSAPKRLTTDNGILLGGLLALGYTPACAIYRPADLLPPYQPLLRDVPALAFVAATGFDLEQVAACRPDGIVTGSGRSGAAGNAYQRIAPTLFVRQPNPALDAAGQVQSAWKTWFANLADALGQRARAATVITALDRRALALRLQLAEQSVGFLSLNAVSSFEVPNDALPLTLVYRLDLGMRHIALPPDAYAPACSASPPAACYSRPQSMETLTRLNGASIILMQSMTLAAANVDLFKANPLFSRLAAVKAGRLAQTPHYTDVGPIGVAWIYSAVAAASGLTEYHATVAGGSQPAVAVSTSLDGTGRFCWAATPPPGTDRMEPLTLEMSAASIPLSTAPTIAPLEHNPAWQTNPPTYQASGCVTLPAAAMQALTSASRVALRIGAGRGTLEPGAPPVVQSAR